MEDLMPQNQEEYVWLHPSQCQSPSLLSGSENDSDEDARSGEVSVIPPTPERHRREKRAERSSSGRNLLVDFATSGSRYVWCKYVCNFMQVSALLSHVLYILTGQKHTMVCSTLFPTAINPMLLMAQVPLQLAVQSGRHHLDPLVVLLYPCLQCPVSATRCLQAVVM